MQSATGCVYTEVPLLPMSIQGVADLVEAIGVLHAHRHYFITSFGHNRLKKV